MMFPDSMPVKMLKAIQDTPNITRMELALKFDLTLQRSQTNVARLKSRDLVYDVEGRLTLSQFGRDVILDPRKPLPPRKVMKRGRIARNKSLVQIAMETSPRSVFDLARFPYLPKRQGDQP